MLNFDFGALAPAGASSDDECQGCRRKTALYSHLVHRWVMGYLKHPETGVYHQNCKFGKMMNQGSLGNIAIIESQKTSKNRINPSRVVDCHSESQQCSGLPYSNKLGRHEILDDFPISTKCTADQEDLSYPRNQSHEKHQAWVDVPKKRDLTIKNGNVYTKDYVRPSKLVLFAHTRKSTW